MSNLISKYKTHILLSFISMASVSSAIITPGLADIEQYYSLSSGNLEWVVSIFLLGYVIGQLIYGPISNRFGRIIALRMGLILNLIGIGYCALSVYLCSYSLLLLGRLICALGTAAGLSCSFTLINELLSKDFAKKVLSYAIVSFTLGIGISVILGGIISYYFSWKLCFVVLFAHGLLMLYCTTLFPETLTNQLELNPKLILKGYLKAIRNKELVIYSCTLGFVSAVSYCYSAAAPVYSSNTLGLSPDIYAYWNLLNILGMLASGFVSAKLMAKYSPTKILSLGLVLVLPCIILLSILDIYMLSEPVLFFITTMLLYLFSGIIFPAASYIASNSQTDRASAAGMMSFINMGSAMLAVIIMGYLPISTLSAFVVVLLVFFIVVCLLLSIPYCFSLISIKR